MRCGIRYSNDPAQTEHFDQAVKLLARVTLDHRNSSSSQAISRFHGQGLRINQSFTKPTLRAVNDAPPDHRPSDNTALVPSSSEAVVAIVPVPDQSPSSLSNGEVIPAFARSGELTDSSLRVRLTEARDAWLARSPSLPTRDRYARDLQQFLAFVGAASEELETLVTIRPVQVAAWRDQLRERGLANVSILRKLTVLRSLFSYLQLYGYTGANPAHSSFVQAPSVPRDGKTVGLSPQDCRRLLEAPDLDTSVGLRDRAILGVLAYSARANAH